jgi:hypothetical protein
LQEATQPGAVRAGAFDTDAVDQAVRGQPVEQRPIAATISGEELHAQHTAVVIQRGRDMHVAMGIHSTRNQARGLYDGHRHPFCFNGSRGGTHVPGRRP